MKKVFALFVLMLLLCSLALGAFAQGEADVYLAVPTTQAFKADAVDEADLNIILQAGLSAASAINQQPWHFAVITNQETMKDISSGMGMGPAPAGAPASAPPAGMPKMPAGGGAKAGLGDSPVAIVIYMNEGTPSPDPNFDCGLAAQSMVITANALGYGTKIVSAPTMALNGDRHDEICEMLGVDKAYKAVAVVLLGYTNTDVDGATGASVRSAFDEKVSFIK